MKNLTFVLLCSILLASCVTYKISISSLSNQLNSNIVSKGYLLAQDNVKGNDLKTIKCIGKKNKEIDIAVTNRTGVRITKNDSTRTTFYFNTLIIRDSAIVGSKTHFFNATTKPIKFSEISTIEIME
jgi:hypothetical protein